MKKIKIGRLLIVVLFVLTIAYLLFNGIMSNLKLKQENHQLKNKLIETQAQYDTTLNFKEDTIKKLNTEIKSLKEKK